MRDECITSKLVDAWLNGKPYAFKHMLPGTVKEGVEKRECDPFLINQARTSLCGPAAFMYWIAKDTNHTYAKYVQDLLIKGKARIGNLEVEPSTSCKNFNPSLHPKPSEVPHHADWIALASLRDSENGFSPYDEITDKRPGATFPRELETWYRLAGYRDTKNTIRSGDGKVDSYSRKSARELQDASDLFDAGYRVSLLVDMSVIKKDVPGSRVPDHWVNLLSRIDFEGEGESRKVKFKRYSWGSEEEIERKLVNFLSGFFGVVAAR